MESVNNFSLDDIIISFAIKDKKHTMEIINSIDSKYLESNHWIFKTIISHFNDQRFKEIPTVDIIREKLENDKTPNGNQFVKDFERLKQLSLQIDSSEFTWHLDKLKLRYNRKIQEECAKNIPKILSQEIDEKEKLEKVNKVIKDTTAGIDSIYRKQINREGSLDESAKERFKKYNFIEQNPEAARGVLTGFKEFDRITNGLHAGELMIIAGDTGTGKSIVMHNIGVNAYLGSNNPLSPLDLIKNDCGHNVLYFSLEMPKESIERRVDSCMGDLYHNQIRDGALLEEDKRRYFNTLKFQMSYGKRFYVVDMPKKVTTREIELKYLEIYDSKFKPDLVIVDYMGIMSANDNDLSRSGNDADWLSLGQITEDLHGFARMYNIPVVTGSQVNRPKDASKPEYSTNRIARSSMAPTNANIVIQIGNREDEYLRTDMPIYITKMRDSEKGSFTLSKNFAKMKVVDLSDDGFSNDVSEENIDDSI